MTVLELDRFSFLVGLVGGGLIGFVIFVIRIWWRGVTAPFRPQLVVQTTKQSPWQVLANSIIVLLFGVLGVWALLTWVGQSGLPFTVVWR